MTYFGQFKDDPYYMTDEEERQMEQRARDDRFFAPMARSLLSLIESDFGQSGVDVRLEAIRCELEAMYERGAKRLRPCGCGDCEGCDVCMPGAEERGV